MTIQLGRPQISQQKVLGKLDLHMQNLGLYTIYRYVFTVLLFIIVIIVALWLHLWFGVRKSDEVRPTHTSLPGRILPATSTTFSSEVTLPSTCPHTLHSIPVARVKPKGFSGWWLEQPNTKRKLAPHQVNFSLPLPLTLHGCFGTQKPHWNSSAQTKSRMGQGTLGPSREAWQPWPWWADGSDGHTQMCVETTAERTTAIMHFIQWYTRFQVGLCYHNCTMFIIITITSRARQQIKVREEAYKSHPNLKRKKASNFAAPSLSSVIILIFPLGNLKISSLEL